MSGYTRFIMLASPRSGTHMLRTSLLGHPQAVVHGEVFNPVNLSYFPYPPNESSVTILNEHIFHPYSEQVSVVGFPIHDFNTFLKPNPCWSDVWDRLRELPDLHVLRLGRNNKFQQFASNVLARMSNRWQNYKQDGDSERQPKRLKLNVQRRGNIFSTSGGEA